MAERKAKPAAKKVADSRTKSGSKVSGKTKTAKATSAKTPKTPPAKKTVVAAPRKTKATSVAKAAPAAKSKVATKKAQATRIKPAATTPKPGVSGKAAKPTPEERYRRVETAAYFIAERHGFQGRSVEHWAAAEREVAARLGQ